MALNETVVEDVANTNFKVVAGAVAANYVAHQQRLQILAEKVLAKSVESMDNIDVGEGLGVAAATRADFAKILGELAASVASIQQYMKGAQTTPPPTA